MCHGLIRRIATVLIYFSRGDGIQQVAIACNQGFALDRSYASARLKPGHGFGQTIG